ncbi:MAG: hypothetical protein KDE09_11045 [Anaerolineales bacterium]|nr:hypothetical protein [Anaerolineales bacterium]
MSTSFRDFVTNRLVTGQFRAFQLFGKDEWPSDCPWPRPGDETLAWTIRANFVVCAQLLPKTVNMLSARCLALFALRYGGRWYLLHLLSSQDHNGQAALSLLAGGQPTLKPRLAQPEVDMGWLVPGELATFYSSFNGFGLFEMSPTIATWYTVEPDYKLRHLGRYLDSPTCSGVNLSDLLCFYPDGAGNCQCFYRRAAQPLTTVDWDHEVNDISKFTPFWAFVDEQLSSL